MDISRTPHIVPTAGFGSLGNTRRLPESFAGALACRDLVENEISPLAADVRSVIIPDSGHYPAGEQPGKTLAALYRFVVRT